MRKNNDTIIHEGKIFSLKLSVRKKCFVVFVCEKEMLHLNLFINYREVFRAIYERMNFLVFVVGETFCQTWTKRWRGYLLFRCTGTAYLYFFLQVRSLVVFYSFVGEKLYIVLRLYFFYIFFSWEDWCIVLRVSSRNFDFFALFSCKKLYIVLRMFSCNVYSWERNSILHFESHVYIVISRRVRWLMSLSPTPLATLRRPSMRSPHNKLNF